MTDHDYRVVAHSRRDGSRITPAASHQEAAQIAAQQRQELEVAGNLSGLGVHVEYRYEGAWHQGRYSWGRH